MVDKRCLCPSVHVLKLPLEFNLRHNKSRAAFAECAQSVLNLLFSLCVDRTRRLIEENDGWPLQDSSSNGHSLQLTARELDAPLSDLSLVACLGQLGSTVLPAGLGTYHH